VTVSKSRNLDLRRDRRRRQHGCWEHLIAAPLWVAYKANLGTLLRTCDAVGACIAVPPTAHYRQALEHGDTLGRQRRPHVHWARPDKDRWVESMRAAGWRIVAVELADGATPLTRLEPARRPTVALLGHELAGVPDRWVEDADECVTIPMVGVGTSLNVAVSASLVLYRLAGLA
jgi:tRNA (guanosine-2'-O-)-methyltransferase